eukprot:TRINITY_DN6789_c0_g1_i1.p1 TRINITY_DN6789_c0_g1~~TRINITY_DN6789_c0_g1_i1.p1  ORF type:complete len:656 (-),score=207.57 TRINITY_DN6789_c0_g1_i1:7-1974(-)
MSARGSPSPAAGADSEADWAEAESEKSAANGDDVEEKHAASCGEGAKSGKRDEEAPAEGDKDGKAASDKEGENTADKESGNDQEANTAEDEKAAVERKRKRRRVRRRASDAPEKNGEADRKKQEGCGDNKEGDADERDEAGEADENDEEEPDQPQAADAAVEDDEGGEEEEEECEKEKKKKKKKKRKKEKEDQAEESAKSAADEEPESPPAAPRVALLKPRAKVTLKRAQDVASSEEQEKKHRKKRRRRRPEDAVSVVEAEMARRKLEKEQEQKPAEGDSDDEDGKKKRKRRRRASTNGELTAPEQPASTNAPASKAAQIRELIRGVYQRRNPTKLSELDTLLSKYAGAEADVYARICEKYGEPMAPLLTDEQYAAKAQSSGSSKGFARKAAGAPPGAANQATGADAGTEDGGEVVGWPFLDEEWTANASDDEVEPQAHSGGLIGSSPSWCVFSNGHLPWTAARTPSGYPLYNGASSMAAAKQPQKPAVPREVDELYGDLADATGASFPRAPPTMYPPGAAPSASGVAGNAARVGGSSSTSSGLPVRDISAFLGEWRDSLGHHVLVERNSRHPRDRSGAQQLDVQLSRPGRSDRQPIRLNVKELSGGGFGCGHYTLDVQRSNTGYIVWEDRRSSGKTSTWRRLGSQSVFEAPSKP